MLGGADCLPYPPQTSPPIVMRSHWPIYGEDEIAEVVDILRSGRVNALHHGDRCRAFERAFADYCGMPHAIAVANGTLALELALRALRIGPGDEVIVPARSFVASASCVAAVGAVPIFADVDPESQTINAATVAAVLTSRTKAVLMVHIAGWPCPADEIIVLARAYGLAVIEDCAQAHGATVGGKPVGSLGDAAAFSFCTDKIMSTGGEGGMLLLRDSEAWARAWAYKDHGKSPDAVRCSHSGGTFRWLHESLGSNWRLTEMQAAIGLRQLAKLPSWLAARRRNAAILNERLGDSAAIRLTPPPPSVGHAYYKYYAFVRPDRLAQGWSRDRIIGEANAAGLPCGSGICPEIYRERAFDAGPSCPQFALPCARALGETSLMLPVDPTLDQAMMVAIGDGLASILRQAEA
jgi:dTDP-4-amino-4,6-dideoxygalactose transaminase